MTAPRRSEIWWVDLNPTRGHEQSGRRPGLVISVSKKRLSVRIGKVEDRTLLAVQEKIKILLSFS